MLDGGNAAERREVLSNQWFSWVGIRRGASRIWRNCPQKLLEGFGISGADLGPLTLAVLSMEEGNLSILPELEEGWCLPSPLNYKRDRGRHKCKHWRKGCVSLKYKGI